jgi:hypothetical protein
MRREGDGAFPPSLVWEVVYRVAVDLDAWLRPIGGEYSVTRWPAIEGAGAAGSREYATPVQAAAVVGPALYSGPFDFLPSVIVRTSASQVYGSQDPTRLRRVDADQVSRLSRSATSGNSLFSKAMTWSRSVGREAVAISHTIDHSISKYA